MNDLKTLRDYVKADTDHIVVGGQLYIVAGGELVPEYWGIDDDGSIRLDQDYGARIIEPGEKVIAHEWHYGRGAAACQPSETAS